MKRGHMDVGGFEKITDEFPPKFEKLEPLAKKLRKILFYFPNQEGLFTGTYSEKHCVKMYDEIISLFDEAIKDQK